MVIHGRIASFAFRQARQLYQVVKYQDKIIDRTYRKAGLYNRGVVKGIQHGLAGGQIVGGIAQLGLIAEDSPGNGGTISQQRKRPQTRTPYKTRPRFSIRNCPEYSGNKYSRSRKRYSRSSYN